MMLNESKTIELTDFFIADRARADYIFGLNNEDAIREINAFGHNFTVAELIEYGVILKAARELTDDALEGVAGGVIHVGTKGNCLALMDVHTLSRNITNFPSW